MKQRTPLRDLPPLPLQQASELIARGKYFLPDETLDDMRRRLARALARPEADPGQWEEPFYRALHFAFPGGRIMANAGAEDYRPNVSTINCTVSRTIDDSMAGIMQAASEAALTLRAGCVSADTLVQTNRGVVTAKQAVTEGHEQILAYDLRSRCFEMRRITRHMTTHVPRDQNIRILAGGISLETSAIHPVLVRRGNSEQYIPAGQVLDTDALVRHQFDWHADPARALEAWWCGAHLGDGAACEKKHTYSPKRRAYARRAFALGRRLIFKIRAAESEAVERYAQFFREFAGSSAKVVYTTTPNGTPVADYCVASFEAARAIDLVDGQAGRKACHLRVPQWIGMHPDKVYLPFLAGLIDTDGTVSTEGGNVVIASQNGAFLEQNRHLLGLFGVSASITRRKPREHVLNGNVVRDSGGFMLKICDSAFLRAVADHMAVTAKRTRIREFASRGSHVRRHVMTEELRGALCEKIGSLSHLDRQRMGAYHRRHHEILVSSRTLSAWAEMFPDLTPLIDHVRRLVPVSKVERGLDRDETYYDFTVDRHNNYCAGIGGLVVIHNCGIGYDFTTLRPRGAHVSGAGATTSGPLPFMDVFDAVCRTVSSAGGRRGAQMGCLDIGHPDVEDFIVAKREAGRLRAFNLSCLISDEFIAAVRDDGQWQLAFPAFESELKAHPIVWRRWPLHEPHHTVNERGETACRVYRKVSAQALWDLIMRSTYAYSDPGFILVDEMNRMNPLWFCETIRATNPCVTGDTWVHTVAGPRQVHELCGRAVELLVNGCAHRTGDEGFFRTGRKAVVRITTKAGYALRLTPDHRVMRVRGDCRFRQETEWCEAAALQPGDRLVLNDHREGRNWSGEGSFGDGYLLGLLIGDGTVKADEAVLSAWRPAQAIGASGTGAGVDAVMAEALRLVRTMPHRADFKGWTAIPSRNEYRLSTASLTALATRYGLQPRSKSITGRMERASSAFQRGLLRGLFDADGSVQGSQLKGVSVRLAQSDLSLLHAAQRILLRLGIASAVYTNPRLAAERLLPDGRGGMRQHATQAQHELVVSGSNLREFEAQVGFGDTVKAARLQTALSAYRRAMNVERFVADVTAVEADGDEDVYDVQVPGLNAFDANGFYAHNCGEQPLPPFGACLLGSVNLASLVRKPFTADAHFDFDTFGEVTRVFARMLDNVVEINRLPLPQQRDEILAKRRHGMGYMGLGSALTMLGIRYGSPESVTFTEKVTRALAVENWRAGLELAREKGAAPVLSQLHEITPEHLALRHELAHDGFKAGDRVPGRVLHARYSRYFQRLAEIEPELVAQLAEHGARYTHATSIAPTGTMAASVGNNASNGIEPSFAHSYTRNMIVPGEKAKRAIRMDSYELLAYRQWIDANVDPDHLPDAFRGTSAGTDPKEHIDVQAAAQRWIDSSISKTINVPSDIGYESFKDLYHYAIDRGLKGCTTFRFNPEVHQGVLVSDADLAKTVYEFRLDDGTTVRLPGDAQVEYDGGTYTAANLYDALKEGFYGKL